MELKLRNKTQKKKKITSEKMKQNQKMNCSFVLNERSDEKNARQENLVSVKNEMSYDALEVSLFGMDSSKKNEWKKSHSINHYSASFSIEGYYNVRIL